MQKIRVLHVIKTLNLGGAEVNLFNLVSSSDGDRFEIHVAYSYGGEIESRFKGSGVRLFKYANGDHKIKSLASIPIILRLAWYILRNRIDIVHTHIFNAHVWGIVAAKLCGCKIVEHVHDFRYLDASEFRKRCGNNRQYSYSRYLRRMSDLVLVLTHQNHDFLVTRRMYSPEQVKEIKNGIPMRGPLEVRPEVVRLLKKRLKIDEDASVILTSARISLEKNIDLIFQVAPEVLRQVPNTVFIVSGNGPLLDYYRMRAIELGLQNRIRMIGFQQDIFPLLTIADVFLLPSFLELHSISVLEAMSMGVPVVISKDVGCHNEFVRNWENGVLMDPFNERGWDESIVRLLKAPDLRRKIGETGLRTCAELFDIRKIARKIEGMYDELVAR